MLKLPQADQLKSLVQRMLHPRTKLGKVTLWFGLVTAFLLMLGLLFRAPSGGWLRGWTQFVATIFLTCVLLMLVRSLFSWIRLRMMWRLRNRLIVTYMFIGVIPIVLLVLMFGIAGYLFAGQYATYIAIAGLNSELEHLEAANNALAVHFRHLSSTGQLTPSLAREIVTGAEETFQDRTVSVWEDDQGFVISQRSTETSAEPFHRRVKGQNDFSGYVMDRGRMHLRAVRRLEQGKKELVVISDVPITNRLLQRTAAKLGLVTLFAPRRREENAKPASPANTGAPSTANQANDSKVTITLGGKSNQNSDRSLTDEGSIQAGAIPASGSRLDPELVFGTFFPVTDWDSGTPTNAGIGVRTRPSVLYSALFGTMGNDAGIYIDLLKGIAIFFAVIELVALFIGARLTRTVTKSVAELYEATRFINRGELNHRIQIRSRDQMAALEQSFNAMMGSLAKLIAEQKEKQRLESELAIAHEVQALLFPRELPQLSTLEVHGICKPARSVSGDYYDFIPLSDDKLVLAVGDISGKGISAALLMATVHAFVRAYSLEPELTLAGATLEAGVGSSGSSLGTHFRESRQDGSLSPGMLMQTLNYQLFRSTPSEKYATMFLGCYDALSRNLLYSNAGHLSPLLLCHQGDLQRLEPLGTVVGLFDSMTYDENSVGMQPGDIFVAYSDGITEPENEFGEFGEERLIELIRRNFDQPLSRISEIVTTGVADWIGGNEQPDDVTLVLARAR